MHPDREAQVLLNELAGGPTDLARLVRRVVHRKKPWVIVSAEAAAAYERRDPQAWAKIRNWLAAQGVRLVEVEGAATRPGRIRPPVWDAPMARGPDRDSGLDRKAEEMSVLGVKLGDLRASMEVVRRIVTDWDTFVGAVEALTHKQAEPRGSFEQLERQHRDLREGYERLGRAHEANLQVLTSLRGAHDLLLREHEAGKHALSDLQGRYEALRQDRQYTTGELHAVLQRLKSWGRPPA